MTRSCLRARVVVILLFGTALLHLAQGALPSKNTDPFPIATSKKGLQVQLVDDAIALGVQHAALNCDLARMIDPAAAPDSLAWESAGRTFHFRRSPIEALDRNLQPLSAAGMQVTLILLSYRTTDPVLTAILRPPQAREKPSSPIYGFNVGEPEGLAWYRATVEFLADRYSANDRTHGRVVGYIIGNEVNSHFDWYEVGEATVEQVVQTYEAAVRVAHEAVRLASSSARVYLSLDHNWTTSGNKDPLKNCHGRDFLDAFARRAREGGDYDWHLAYHPYPRALGEPRTWQDKGLRDDAETDLITPRNLEVLTSYLQRPELLYEGKPRHLILSEQGFHSPDRPEGERWQAAGFCYTWAKIQKLEGIDAFILHRHVDHPKEGGLHLGLWTNKTNSTTPDRHKLLYEVFRACDTPEWPAAFAPYLEDIGIKNWSEVR